MYDYTIILPVMEFICYLVKPMKKLLRQLMIQ